MQLHLFGIEEQALDIQQLGFSAIPPELALGHQDQNLPDRKANAGQTLGCVREINECVNANTADNDLAIMYWPEMEPKSAEIGVDS